MYFHVGEAQAYLLTEEAPDGGVFDQVTGTAGTDDPAGAVLHDTRVNRSPSRSVGTGGALAVGPPGAPQV